MNKHHFVALVMAALGAAAAAPSGWAQALKARPQTGVLGGNAPALSAGGAGMRETADSVPAGDFIVAVVGQEIVTHSELQQRVQRLEQEFARRGASAQPRAQLQREALDRLVDERAQLAYARESGMRVDDASVDRAVEGIAAQNGLSLPQLRERLQREGISYTSFRNNIQDEILLSRVRDRDVEARIRISDADIDAYLAEQRRSSGLDAAAMELNIAQILIAIPDGASEAQVAERRARAEEALAKARAGEPFVQLVQAYSDAPDRAQGGLLGLRPVSRLPDLFVEAVQPLKVGEVSGIVRSGAGFHVLRLVERREGGVGTAVVQTRARHILLRPGPKLSEGEALQRLGELRRRIESGQASFAQLAREQSEDGSARNGGELGWANPGQFVPEFERVMNSLGPGQLGEPFVSRFGVHLVQVMERRTAQIDPRQQRDIVRNILRERKYDDAYREWAREIRARTYVEYRELPL